MKEFSYHQTNLYILCGVPASGKSTWISQHGNFVEMGDDEPLDTWVCRDYIRQTLLEKKFGNTSNLTSEQYFSKEKEVYHRFVREIQNAIYYGKRNVFVDATNINIASRNKLFKALSQDFRGFEKSCYCTAVLFMTNYNEAVKRDENRTGFSHVGAQVIERFERDIEWPEKYSTKELFQFDELMVII